MSGALTLVSTVRDKIVRRISGVWNFSQYILCGRCFLQGSLAAGVQAVTDILRNHSHRRRRPSTLFNAFGTLSEPIYAISFLKVGSEATGAFMRSEI